MCCFRNVSSSCYWSESRILLVHDRYAPSNPAPDRIPLLSTRSLPGFVCGWSNCVVIGTPFPNLETVEGIVDFFKADTTENFTKPPKKDERKKKEPYWKRYGYGYVPPSSHAVLLLPLVFLLSDGKIAWRAKW